MDPLVSAPGMTAFLAEAPSGQSLPGRLRPSTRSTLDRLAFRQTRGVFPEGTATPPV